MTHEVHPVVLQRHLRSDIQVSASGMPLGDTKGCQPGTEKSYGG